MIYRKTHGVKEEWRKSYELWSLYDIVQKKVRREGKKREGKEGRRKGGRREERGGGVGRFGGCVVWKI